MIKRAFFLLALLGCGDSTAPGAPPTIVFMSYPITTSYPVLDIFAMDSLGGRVTNITHDAAWDDDPAWSPDGSLIIFSSQLRDTTTVWHLYLMRYDGSGITPLPTGGVSEWGPDWSPAGKIAFIEYGHLSVMNADGTGVTQIHNEGISDDHPSWSPDGRIAFYSTRSNAQSGGHIYVINADGTGLTSIGDSTATEQTPSWSRDGSRIAFSSNRDRRAFQIWTMNPDGSNPTQLTNDSAGNSYPSWSPDGGKIVFVSHRDSVDEIYVMNADGSNQTRLTHIPATYKLKPRWRPT